MAESLYKRLHLPKNKKHTVLLATAIAVVALIVGGIFLLNRGGDFSPVAFKVGDKEVTKKDFDHYIELANNYNVSRENVKASLIQYYKNQTIAERHGFSIPDVFIDNAKSASAIAFLKDLNVTTKYQKDTNDYTRLRSYNAAFTSYIQEYVSGGYGIVMYDFPYDANGGLAEVLAQQYASSSIMPEEVRSQLGGGSSATAKEKAEKLRSQLLSSEVTNREALQVIADDPVAVSGSKYGARFVALDGSQVASDKMYIEDGVMNPATLLPLLKDAKLGVSEVHDLPGRSYYFIDYKYKVDKNVDFASQVEKEMNQIRVVDYDRN